MPVVRARGSLSFQHAYGGAFDAGWPLPGGGGNPIVPSAWVSTAASMVANSGVAGHVLGGKAVFAGSTYSNSWAAPFLQPDGSWVSPVGPPHLSEPTHFGGVLGDWLYRSQNRTGAGLRYMYRLTEAGVDPIRGAIPYGSAIGWANGHAYFISASSSKVPLPGGWPAVNDDAFAATGISLQNVIPEGTATEMARVSTADAETGFYIYAMANHPGQLAYFDANTEQSAIIATFPGDSWPYNSRIAYHDGVVYLLGGYRMFYADGTIDPDTTKRGIVTYYVVESGTWGEWPVPLPIETGIFFAMVVHDGELWVMPDGASAAYKAVLA